MKNFLFVFISLSTFVLHAQTREFINPTYGDTKTLYIAGQLGSGETMEEQLRISFQNVLKQLEAVGGSFADVVKMTLYVVDYEESQLEIISKVRKEVFGAGSMPAITMLGVEALALNNMKVVTEAVAVINLTNKLLSPSELREAEVFQSIESTYGNEEAVFILDLSGSELIEIPQEVFDLPNLQSLNLSNTGIRVISEKIARLKNLQKLNLDHLASPNEYLTNLPANISRLQNLEEINLNGNPNLNLSKVFDQISELPKLKILAVMNNDITELTESVINLKTLEQVWIGQNPDLNIASTLIRLNQLPNLKHLGFGGIGIKTISFNNGSFQNLENLWLAGNEISNLNGIEYLKNLKSISLNNNKLERLPSRIYQSKNLESIGLNNNPDLDFEDTFKRLGTLEKLTILSLNNNGITSLPSSIAELKSLQFLVLRNNPISDEDVEKAKKMLPENCAIIR